MPTAQRETGQNAFSRPYATGTRPLTGVPRASTAARVYTPAPAPAQSVPVSRPRARRPEQTAWMLLMVFAAFATVIIGLAYIYGYALVTKEGYRRARLKTMLRQEREMAQQWKQQLALTHTPTLIEHKARLNGMVRPDEKWTLTVGE